LISRWRIAELRRSKTAVADIQLFGGTGIDDVRTTFERTSIDSVIMGGGIDLET
jgi:hypothetical protein